MQYHHRIFWPEESAYYCGMGRSPIKLGGLINGLITGCHFNAGSVIDSQLLMELES